MPRPRVHDPDRVLDAAESLAVSSGPAAVTIRAISAAVGVSNGAVYHTFGSRTGLLARAWLRAGQRFLAAQTALVDRALATPNPQAGAQAVLAAADTPAAFAEQYPNSCLMLLTVPREELFDPDLPDEIATEIRDLEATLVGLMIRLAVAVWDRKDAAAVDTITMCIVDLPTAILLRRNRLRSKTAREQLRAAGERGTGHRAAPRKDNPVTIGLDYDDKIAILDLGDDENRFSPAFLDDINGRLDEVVASGAHGLVTTASGKFYTNGLDWTRSPHMPSRPSGMSAGSTELLARMLTLPVPSAAAVVGHAFGAGAMLALAHDFRVMRADRGYFCFPEVDINIPFTPGMAALIQAKLAPQSAVASMTTGRRFGGDDAASIGIVDATAAEGAVMDAAVDLLRSLGGKNQGTLGAIKQTMFARAVDTLTAEGAT